MSGPLHPMHPDSLEYEQLQDAGRVPSWKDTLPAVAPPRTCDRCYAEVAVVVPYTTDIASGRILMRCCLDCQQEMQP